MIVHRQLLSTYLPQNGANDSSGILGFLMSDIRKEIAAAAKRKCIICDKSHASLMCRGCKEFMHVKCGRIVHALFQFEGEFPVYCTSCMPLTEHQQTALKTPRDSNMLCTICFQALGPYKPTRWIYGPCCGNGYAHRVCLQKYAMEAGYYLRCIWCRSSEFRGQVRKLGIFVPDRDAQWEQKNAYRELHRGHQRCDMPECHNPKGREYVSAKWELILCSMCGSFGAHNPHCIPGLARNAAPLKEFKCSVCMSIEERIAADERSLSSLRDHIDMTIYTLKHQAPLTENSTSFAPYFSDEGSVSSDFSTHTVLNIHSRSGGDSTILPVDDKLEHRSEHQVTDSEVVVVDFSLTETGSPDNQIVDLTGYSGSDESSSETEQSPVIKVEASDPIKQNTTPMEVRIEQNETSIVVPINQNTTPMEVRIEQNETSIVVPINQNTTPMAAPIEQNRNSVEVPMEKNPISMQVPIERNTTPMMVRIENNLTSIEVPINQNQIPMENRTPMAVPIEQTQTSMEVPIEQNPTSMNVPIEQNLTLMEVPIEQNTTPMEVPIEQQLTPMKIPINHQPSSMAVASPGPSQTIHCTAPVLGGRPEPTIAETHDTPAIALPTPTVSTTAEIATPPRCTGNGCEEFKREALFKVYEYDDKWRCTNSAVVRIDLNEPRFKGKTLEEIYKSTDPNLLTEQDVIKRMPDIGVWAEINAIIDEYAD